MLLIRDQNSQPGRSYLKFLIIVLIPILISCSDSQEQDDSTAPAAVMPESFTFFDLGINSRLNKKVRQELGNKLGRDAIEHRSIMDLEINYKGFLQKYFPGLNELNQKLNFPPGLTLIALSMNFLKKL